MADITPLGKELWEKFHARLREHGVSDVRCVSANIMAADAIERIGRHDVVHCSGVIYHMPDPMGLLRQLRDLTNEYLILTSIVLPERIETSAGTLSLQGGDMLFVPALDARQLAVLREFFGEPEIGSIVKHDSETWTTPDGTPRYGPWWWLFTPSLLRRMVQLAGLRLIEDAPVWEGRSHGYLCRKA